MEASVAGDGAQAGEAQGAQGADGAEQQQQGGFDMDALKDHIGQEFDRRFDGLAEQLAPPGGEAEGAGDEGGEGEDLTDEQLARMEQELYGPDGEVDPDAAQQFIDTLTAKQAKEMVGPEVQRALAPVMSALDDLRLANDSRAIAEQHPRMATDQEFARGVMDRAAQTAQALGVGDEEAAKLVVSPAFIDLHIKAAEAEQGAAGSPAGEGSETELESGGSSVGAAESNANEAREIVQAGRRSSIWM